MQFQSRGKDSSKSSKKNKESKDGAASPSSGTRDATQSPSATPSSSTSALVNDIRNKPLPPNNAGFVQGEHGSITSQQPPQLPALGTQTSTPDRLSGSSSQNGGGTPTRHGSLPPTVVVSPSPMVSALHLAAFASFALPPGLLPLLFYTFPFTSLTLAA